MRRTVRYSIVYNGAVIGHSMLEHSRGLTNLLLGRFLPAPGFEAAREALRPYARAVCERDERGEGGWRARGGGGRLPPMELRILDPEGREVPAWGAHLSWPGDVPGWPDRGVLVIGRMPEPAYERDDGDDDPGSRPDA